MKNLQLEYVWLDGYSTANIRSKIKILKTDKEEIAIEDVPDWNFDGSSTRQAPGSMSECILKPVRLYSCGFDNYIIMCEVMNTDGTPHETNTRAALSSLYNETKDENFWFGFEQEYFITKGFVPLGFPSGGYPKPQGLYYCGVGTNQVVGRNLVLDHLRTCLDMGIDLTGINAEVAVGQWEYQCFSDNALKACDDLWVSRYIMYILAEPWGWDIDITPKPVKGDWNGSGCHTNFSNTTMRDAGDEEYYQQLIVRMRERHETHISSYGENNDERLTGDHETQHIGTFSYGVGDRGASIRIPSQTEKNNWKGYLEDRRPASNCDPYKVAKLIIETAVGKY